jgi:hypothetical protein
VEADFEDTVLVPSRPRPQADDGVDEDTVVPRKWARQAIVVPAQAPAPAPKAEPIQTPEPIHSAEPARLVEPAATAESVQEAEAAQVPVPQESQNLSASAAAQGQTTRSAKTATKRRTSKKQGERHPPSLVEPAPARQRRVPLTHKRLQETLRVPEAAHEPSVLSAAQPAAVAIPVFGFRLGERAPISLDVPALVGRHPAAPRIPGKVFPRLVRVPSALSEVSGTHIELRQDGASVIVTDLRSTNGTVVRMPGSRPIKLRQGESLVVRPGTLVDIGDGNVIEILSPPRLGVPADSAGERHWS